MKLTLTLTLLGLVLLASVLSVACGKEGGSPVGPTPPVNPTPTTPTIASIAINTPSTTLAIGSSAVFTATATMSDGTSRTLDSATWGSDNPSVATVAAATTPGAVEVTAVGPGSATIYADAEGRRGTVLIDVPNVSLSGRFSPVLSVRLVRRPVVERRVGPAPVVEVHPPADSGMGLGAGRELREVDALVLERSPQPLDEHVVHPAALAVHRDANARLREHVGEVDAAELAALIAIADLRRAIALERLAQGLDAEARLERVGQPPGQYLAARPVHHGDQVQKAPLQGECR